MKSIKINLKSEEEKKFEFKFYQFNGAQIAVNQFLNSNKFQYNEEHYNRLIQTFTEKMKELNDFIIHLLKINGYQKISLKIFNYEYTKGALTVYF